MFQFGIRKKGLFSINISIRFNALADAGRPVALTQYERLTRIYPPQVGCHRYSVAVALHTGGKMPFGYSVTASDSADLVRSAIPWVR
jgi:hypothetical protein